ncbi:MAG: GAF domain-containing protein [Anaerolineae bacterium]
MLPLAMATDMRQTLLAPLEAGGQLVGLIQVSNPRGRQPFDDTDGRLLTMLTAQLSGMVRISQLLENMENRTQQMGSLVSVATAIGASLDLESVLDTIVEAASEVLGAQRTGIFVLDAANNVLNLVAAQGVSDRYRRLSQAVPILLHGRSHAVAANETVIAEDVLAEAEFAEVAPLAGSEGFRAFADVPLRRGEQPVGLLTVQFTEPHYFDEDEENLLHILAEQAAVAIENARLYEQTGEELHLRIESLEALQRVTREITLTLDLDRILALVLSEAVHFREVDAGFVLFWHESGAPELRGFSGYSEEEIADLRDLLNDPEKRHLLRDFLAQPEMRYFEDLAEYGGVSLPLPQACSLILAPVLYQERLTATIVIQNRQPRAFSPATLEFVEGLAAQTSIAVGNAERYQDQMERGELMRKRAEQARLFLEVSRTMRSDRPLDDILLDMAYATQEASGFEIVMISILQGGMTQRAAAAGVPLTEFERMKEVRQPWARISSLMRDEFRLGQCYYIPAERQHIWRGDLDVFEERISQEERRPGMWHPQDLLIVPLQTTQGDYLGYMSVDRPLDERAPTRISVEILELFAAQIALAIENSRLVENLRLQLNTLTLFNELNRSITTKLDLSLVLNTVVQAVTNLLDYDYATIFLQERESGRFVPLASSGYAVELLTDISFARGEGLVGSVIQSGMPLVLEDAQSDRRFMPGPVEIGSSVLVPLTAEGHPVGVLAADRKETGDFMPTEVATLTAVADQVSVAVENARLFEEVKRFSVEMEQRVEERTEELADALDELRDEQDRTELLYRIASELVASLDIDRVLNKALALLRNAVDAARGSVLLLDNDTGYLYYRAAIGAEWSVPPGGTRSKLSRDEGLVGWVMKRRRSVVISDVYEDDRWVAREDDATRSVLAVPVLGGEGQANGAIFLHAYTADAFSEDDRRLVEAAAIQLGNALNNAELYRLIREQTERLGTMLRAQQIEAVKSEAILEGIADGVMVADANGRITLFNAAAERILSISRSQATGRMVDEMLGLYGLKAQEWLTEVRKWQKNPASYETGDFLAERLELEKRVVSVHLSPVISQSHEFLGMVSVFRDVTAEVEADRAKSDFVSTVSHELRTPMTAIKGYVDLLLMGTTGDLTKMQAQFLEVVRTNADRLTALVNDLLDLSRIETGKIVLNPRPLDMGNVIEQAVMTIAPKAREKGLVARDVVPDGLPKVYGDPDRVFQILTNLLGNAFKYTPIGGEISVHAYIRDAMMHVAVTDTGIGISREDQESIFDRFFRVDDPLVQEESGTGLGLSITASLVKMQGGEVFVESEPGEGSIFTFTLPLAEGEQTESVGRPPEDFVLIRPVKILVVDDDAEVAELLRLTLTGEDREVLVATTGEEALHLAREQRPDLISLDIRLPDLDGFELLQLLKREPETAEIPVIIVSVVEDVQRGLDLGAVDYLTKPIDEGRLRQVVDDALSNRNLVLVVDDDYQILVTMREALRAQGLGVRTTGRGARALQLARRLRPALLLLDLSLPDLDGHRVLDNLRQNPHTGDIPVIVMMESEGDDSGSLSQGIERRGGLRSISKPFSPQQLAEEIALLVNGRDADKE